MVERVERAESRAANGVSLDPSAGSGVGGSVPNLGAETVVAVFEDTAALESAYRDLAAAGFGAENVSIVRQGDDPAPPMSASDTKTGTGITAGAAAGAVLGGIAGLASLAIPGVGMLIAAGPIGAALGGALTGGAVGALAGSFAGLGIPKERAAEYEAAVRRGGTFLSVKTEGGAAGDRVTALLRQHGAEHVERYNPTM